MSSAAQFPGPASGVILGAPLFELDLASDGSLLAAVSSAGVVRIRSGTAELVAELPGVNAVAALGTGESFAVTGGSLDPAQIFPTSRKTFRVSPGRVREVADLWAYEQAVNPDQFWNTSAVPVESNPFDVAVLNGGHVLVADAAANDILLVEPNGGVDWVAVLTPVFQNGPQPVPTSVAIGPDGAYYVGELTGFSFATGLSRVWRITPGSRHVVCPSAACTVVATGFTSIMDLAFGPDGTLFVVEFDEGGWLGVEANGFAKTATGGTVSACSVATGSCSVLASGLSLPTALTVDRDGGLWVAEHQPMLFAAARVRRIQ
jgi:glucose/arabinose dehydrogenase